MTPAQRFAGTVYTAAGTPVFSHRLAARKVEVARQNQATISSAKVWSAAMGVLGVACFVAGATMMVYGFKAVPLDMSLVIGGGVTTLGGVVAIIFIARVIHNSIATERNRTETLEREQRAEVTVENMIAQIESYAEGDAEGTIETIAETLSERPTAFPEVIARANEYFEKEEGVPSGEAQGRIFEAMAQQTTQLGVGNITDQISSALAIALLAHLDPEQSNLAQALMKCLDHEQISSKLEELLALAQSERSELNSTLQITFNALSRHPKVYAGFVEHKDRTTASHFKGYLLNVYHRMETQDQVTLLGVLTDENVLLSLITNLLKEEKLKDLEVEALARHPQVIARVIFAANGERPAVLNHFIPVMMYMSQAENKAFFTALVPTAYGAEVLSFVIEHLLFLTTEEQLAKVAEGVADYSEVVARVILRRLDRDTDLYKDVGENGKNANARLARVMFSLSDNIKERVYGVLKADVGFGKRLLNVMLGAVLRAWDEAYNNNDETFAADPIFKLLTEDPDRFGRLVEELNLTPSFVVRMVDQIKSRANQRKIRQDNRVSSVLLQATLQVSGLSPVRK